MKFMDFKGKNVLITGGAGHIGSNLAISLVNQGAHVKIADNLWRGNLDYLRNGDGHIIDLDKDFLNVDLRIMDYSSQSNKLQFPEQ